ncbi:Hypothetical predicted protein, partial [Prunus dulcis]
MAQALEWVEAVRGSHIGLCERSNKDSVAEEEYVESLRARELRGDYVQVWVEATVVFLGADDASE